MRILRRIEQILAGNASGAWWAAWCRELLRVLEGKDAVAALVHVQEMRREFFGGMGSLRDLALGSEHATGFEPSPDQDELDRLLASLWELAFEVSERP